MAIENLTPENRVERLLSGADLEPATRLEYFLKQAALPAYDDEDIGKVLTVGSEYETGAEAIPAQTVTIAQGTATVQNANVSQWTEGQSLQVIYRGTTYTGQITDVEGALVFGTADFTLRYDSSTGVLTVEDNEHSGDNTISAQYVTEHANADWAEPSGGSGFSIQEYTPITEPFYVPDLLNDGTRLFDPSTDEIFAWLSGRMVKVFGATAEGPSFITEDTDFPNIINMLNGNEKLLSVACLSISAEAPDQTHELQGCFAIIPNSELPMFSYFSSTQPSLTNQLLGLIKKDTIAYYNARTR